MNDTSAPDRWPASLPPAERQRIAQITREAWRELGFWYECDLARRRWRFRADRRGLRSLAGVVREFIAAEPAYEPGEHVHLGPYCNLRIIRAEHPVVSWRGIGAPPAEWERFVAELESFAAAATELESGAHAGHTHELCAGFAREDGFAAVLQIEPEGFDPSSADATLDSASER